MRLLRKENARDNAFGRGGGGQLTLLEMSRDGPLGHPMAVGSGSNQSFSPFALASVFDCRRSVLGEVHNFTRRLHSKCRYCKRRLKIRKASGSR